MCYSFDRVLAVKNQAERSSLLRKETVCPAFSPYSLSFKMPLINRKNVSAEQPAERKRIVNRPDVKKLVKKAATSKARELDDNLTEHFYKTGQLGGQTEKTVTNTPVKKATKKTTKKSVKKPAAAPRLTAKELFELAPTVKFPIKPWQQGVAIGEMDLPDVGIAFPSICWEMFVGRSVLPVSSCFALAGPTGSFKSHLVVEMARWILNSGGYTLLAENETKYNKDMAKAIIGQQAQEVYVYNCASFSQVQQALLGSLKKVNKEQGKEPPLLMQIVDSIVGNATGSQQDKVLKAGQTERDYPSNALAAANFLPVYMPMLGNKPYIGLWVTHSKEEPKENAWQAPKISMKGGGTWEYRCRIAFILERITTKPKYADRTWKVGLKLTLKKDMADRGFSLPFAVIGKYIPLTDEGTGDVYSERIVKFCWHAATLNIWKDPEKFGYPAYYSEIVKDLTGFTETGTGANKGFIAPKIGVSKADAARDPKIIMDAFYADENILDQLSAEMGIQKGIELSPEFSFNQAMKKAKVIALRRAKRAQETANITYLKREELNECD